MHIKKTVSLLIVSLTLCPLASVFYAYDGHIWPELELSVRIEATQFNTW